MNKTGTFKKAEKTKFFKTKSFLVLVVVFIFVLILSFFFGEGGLFEIIRIRAKIDELRKSVVQLEKEKAALIKEIEELKKNPMALEKKAREKLWLMKKNEKVVVIVRNSDKADANEPGKKKTQQVSPK